MGSASRERFSGRRYNVLRGLWIAFEDAPGAAVVRGLAALAAGAATGPLLVLAARLADRILVLDGGRIVEDGTHEQLLARRGLYHRMFTAQAAWYRRN